MGQFQICKVAQTKSIDPAMTENERCWMANRMAPGMKQRSQALRNGNAIVSSKSGILKTLDPSPA
jgi:hypothetical protein